ncbi:hypothetical protein LXL04_014259 [Taraxacum kok-saghyz]
MHKKKVCTYAKFLEKKKSFFRKFFFATGLIFERFLAPRSRFFEKVNGLGVLGLVKEIECDILIPSFWEALAENERRGSSPSFSSTENERRGSWVDACPVATNQPTKSTAPPYATPAEPCCTRKANETQSPLPPGTTDITPTPHLSLPAPIATDTEAY